MGRAVRVIMRRLADELGDRAELKAEPDGDDGERLFLVPRNPAAASVSIEHDPDSDDGEWRVRITDHDLSDPVYEHDLSWVETLVRAAVDGKVRVLEGPGRVRVEIQDADGECTAAQASCCGEDFCLRPAGRSRHR